MLFNNAKALSQLNHFLCKKFNFKITEEGGKERDRQTKIHKKRQTDRPQTDKYGKKEPMTDKDGETEQRQRQRKTKRGRQEEEGKENR